MSLIATRWQVDRVIYWPGVFPSTINNWIQAPRRSPRLASVEPLFSRAHEDRRQRCPQLPRIELPEVPMVSNITIGPLEAVVSNLPGRFHRRMTLADSGD